MHNTATIERTRRINACLDYQVIAQRRIAEDSPEIRDLVRLAELEAGMASMVAEARQIIRRRIEADQAENLDHRKMCEMARAECESLERLK